MAFQKFKEYLNRSGKMDKVTVTGDADTGPDGKDSPRPPKPVKSGKNWKNYTAKEAAQVEDGGDGTKNVEYSAAGKDPGQQTADGKAGKADPLGEKGPDNLIYKPKTWDQTLKMKKLHDTVPESTKTEQFLSATKGLSTDQYAEFVLKQRNAKAVKHVLETVEIINNDALLIETFVRELKRKGGFNHLMEVVLDQPEAYQPIAQKLTNENNARRLQKAFNEQTDAPATDDIVQPKPASKMMPPKADSMNSKGQPVEPAVNARQAKTVQEVPLAGAQNVMMSKSRK